MNRIFAVMRFSPLFLVAACASNPQPTAPSPQPAPAATPPPAAPAARPAPAAAAAPAAATVMDLSGVWDFSVDAGGQVIPGEMTLTRSGTTYGGTVVPTGMTPATVRSATIEGRQVTIVIDTPDGEAVFQGEVSADGRTLTGSIAYQGQALGFNARKR